MRGQSDDEAGTRRVSGVEAASAKRLSSKPSMSREELEELRRASHTMLTYGSFVCPAYFLVDVFAVTQLQPQASIGTFLLLRVLCQICLAAGWLLTRKPGASNAQLLAAELIALTGPCAFIAIMGVQLGGVINYYTQGISIVLLFRVAFVPSRWQRTLGTLLVASLAYPAVLLAWSVFDSNIAAQWASWPIRARFLVDYSFVITTAAVGSIASHAVWVARRQVFEARKLGRYRLKAQIGAGGMGEVWLAWDATLRRDVALKILNRDASLAAKGIARFEREAQAASRLDNPHSIRVFDFGASDDGIWYIAMEHLVGADLSALVQRHGALPPARAVHFAMQACESLAEAHERGIVHRDVKPDNLFVTRVGDQYDFLKLLDFGIAKVQDATADHTQTQAGWVGGTPGFMAPEVCTGVGADERSDLYSFGASLYFLLTGRPPFVADTPAAVMVAHTTQTPESPSRHLAQPLPSALEALILRCLEKSPDRRFQSARELRDALEAALGDELWSPEDARRFWLTHSTLFRDEHGALGSARTIAAAE